MSHVIWAKDAFIRQLSSSCFCPLLLWVMTHNRSWVMSHIQMNRVMSHIYVSCHTSICHVWHIKESFHFICMKCNDSVGALSRVAQVCCSAVLWDTQHTWMSHVTHMKESCCTLSCHILICDMTQKQNLPTPIMGHVWHINESCLTYTWVMSFGLKMSSSGSSAAFASAHSSYESCHTWMSHVTNMRVMSHMNMSRLTYTWVMSLHMCDMRRLHCVAQLQSHVTYIWVMSHICMSCLAYTWVMSLHMSDMRRVRRVAQLQSHVTYMWVMSHTNESCHIWIHHVSDTNKSCHFICVTCNEFVG